MRRVEGGLVAQDPTACQVRLRVGLPVRHRYPGESLLHSVEGRARRDRCGGVFEELRLPTGAQLHQPRCDEVEFVQETLR